MDGSSHVLMPSFNRSIQVEGRDERLGSDPGAILLREIMELSGLRRLLADKVHDPRRQEATWYSIAELTCIHILLIAQGWRHAQDANRLRHAPALGLAATETRGPTPADRVLPSQPTLSRGVDILARDENRKILTREI